MSEPSNIAVLLDKMAAQFDNLCVERHEVGVKEYGVFTFLENDVIRMMLEELADTANYCRMQAVKLLILQEQLEELLGDKAEKINSEDGELTMGMQAFKGTGEVGWNK